MSRMVPRKASSIISIETDTLNRKIVSQGEAVRALRNGIPGSDVLIGSIPFSAYDTTAGTETELQASVKGRKEDVDLPMTIEQSSYFSNIIRRATAGDTSRKLISDIERFLQTNTDDVWENSLVRFRRSVLTPFADSIFMRDLRANKRERMNGLRSDVHKFVIIREGTDYLRIPVSYLMKLSLADAISAGTAIPRLIARTGYRLMQHFTNDNTSPETYSFHVDVYSPEARMGRVTAKEMASRFLFSQLLIMYANEKFMLREDGQEAMVFFSPHTPVRQKQLNRCVPDSFYRELFMSPCLSGWNEGEAKHSYMHLCHEVLSRSQLNTLTKLRDAGIISTNLVVLPDVSNTSLANNGTHLSLGSLRMSQLLADRASGFTRVHEKYVGDLAVKIVEHFLPLFVGTYTASPHRIDFVDFHPERVLGFLPHELDYTHLRMLWRRWRKKARIKVFGNAITPFGPLWLDKLVATIFGLAGDMVPDYRLIDYLVCLMSTETSPALNGVPGNTTKLKSDLADMGVFHSSMSLYLLYKQREFDAMGFSGFEGRHYSLFESFEIDMGYAATLQNLVTALAFKYIMEGRITHDHIPDNPNVESERRQIIFGNAIGIPTFFIRNDTKNIFLQSIVSRTQKVRASRRYPGYIRVNIAEYMKALIEVIEEDGAPLIEMFGAKGIIDDLKERSTPNSPLSASSRLLKGILGEAPGRAPFNMKADQFNLQAERYYREGLRKKHLGEALRFAEEDLRGIAPDSSCGDEASWAALRFVLGGMDPARFLRMVKKDLMAGRASIEAIKKTIYLLLIIEHKEQLFHTQAKENYDATPVYQAGNS